MKKEKAPTLMGKCEKKDRVTFNCWTVNGKWSSNKVGEEGGGRNSHGNPCLVVAPDPAVVCLVSVVFTQPLTSPYGPQTDVDFLLAAVPHATSWDNETRCKDEHLRRRNKTVEEQNAEKCFTTNTIRLGF